MMASSFRNNTILTDRLLRNWIRCKRKAWLDLHGDETKRLWSAHRTLHLDHQQKSFAALITQQPGSGKKTNLQKMMRSRTRFAGGQKESDRVIVPIIKVERKKMLLKLMVEIWE